MRSRLLRVLGHLKAAAFHLAEAQRLCGKMYCYDEQRAIAQVSVNASIKAVQDRYAAVVYEIVEPAELPR